MIQTNPPPRKAIRFKTVGKLKRFKRVALRCEKTAKSYGSVVALALGFILIKSVHTTWSISGAR